MLKWTNGVTAKSRKGVLVSALGKKGGLNGRVGVGEGYKEGAEFIILLH